MANFEFNVPEYLGSQGLEIKGVNPDNGTYQVSNAQGEEFEFSPQEFLAQQNIDPAEADVIVNTPSTAFQHSPVSAVDRAKLSFSNSKGAVNFLKQNFDEVTTDADNGIVVKKDGAWFTVDPETLGTGDAWDKTKELVADIADLASFVPAVAVGAATSATGPLAIGAAGAAGTAINTALGRALGTYEGDVTEQIEDVALDGILSAVGAKVLPGVKPAASKVLKGLSKWASRADGATKEALAQMYGAFTRAGAPAARVLFEDPKKVINNMKKLGRGPEGKLDLDSMLKKAKRVQIADSEELLESAVKELPNRYGKLLDDLLSEKQIDNLTVKGSDIFQGVLDEVEKAGFAKIEGGKLIPLSAKDIQQRLSQGIDAELLDAKTFRLINGVINNISKFSGTGELKGKAAGKFLTSFNKLVNKLERDVPASTPPQVKRFTTQIANAFRNKVGQSFDNAGLSQEYAQLSALYKRFGDDVSEARNIINRDGVEAFTNKLISDTGRNVKPIDLAESLVELVGSRGSDLYKNIIDVEAAKRFAPLAPKLGLFPAFAIGGTAGTAFGAGGGVLSLPALASLGIVSTQVSPRLVAGQAALAQGVRDTLLQSTNIFKSLSSEELERLATNPEFIRNLSLIGSQAISEGIEVRNTLVNQAGAGGEGQ